MCAVLFLDNLYIIWYYYVSLKMIKVETMKKIETLANVISAFYLSTNSRCRPYDVEHIINCYGYRYSYCKSYDEFRFVISFGDKSPNEHYLVCELDCNDDSLLLCRAF